MYKVVGYYDDIYPMTLGEFETLEEARVLRDKAYEQFNDVRIIFNGEVIR